MTHAPIAVGDQAPDFSLPTADGKNIHLYETLQQSTVVLSFYVKAFTPLCVAQVCGFRDAFPLFQEDNVQVLAISSDRQEQAQRFAKQNRLPFPLLIDEGGRIRKLFGVPRLLGLFPGRATYVIGQDGRVMHVVNANLQGTPHISDSLQFIAGSEVHE